MRARTRAVLLGAVAVALAVGLLGCGSKAAVNGGATNGASVNTVSNPGGSSAEGSRPDGAATLLWKQAQGKWSGRVVFSADGSKVFCSYPAVLDARTGQKLWEGPAPKQLSDKTAYFRGDPEVVALPSGVYVLYPFDKVSEWTYSFGSTKDSLKKMVMAFRRIWPTPEQDISVPSADISAYAVLREAEPAAGVLILGQPKGDNRFKDARFSIQGNRLVRAQAQYAPSQDEPSDPPSGVKESPLPNGKNADGVRLVKSEGRYQLWLRDLTATPEGQREPVSAGFQYILFDKAGQRVKWARSDEAMLQASRRTEDAVEILDDGRVISSSDSTIYGDAPGKDQPFPLSLTGAVDPGVNAAVANDATGKPWLVDFGSGAGLAKYSLGDANWTKVADVTKDRKRFLLTAPDSQEDGTYSVWSVSQ